ncbi:MAG: hypothetical protein P4L81_06380 [Candidatus Pacebacteria bacterium]|nr:hypothetical protein [Candidatus Paceibacterota bacterium]
MFCGAHLTFGGLPLDGPREPNNLGNFRFPLDGIAAAEWMCSIVREVVGDNAVVKRSRRGATFEDFGPKKRSYDIIPAFMYKIDGQAHHIIPNDDAWEANPIQRDMQTVIDLDREFSRDAERKVMGYRDLVKLLKRLKDVLGWGKSHGITSFMIRFAVSATLESSASRFNHKQLAAAIALLQQWLDAGSFPDPYAASQPLKSGLVALNERLPNALFNIITRCDARNLAELMSCLACRLCNFVRACASKAASLGAQRSSANHAGGPKQRTAPAVGTKIARNYQVASRRYKCASDASSRDESV